MPISTNEIKAGNKIEIDREAFVILDNEHHKPGKGQAFNIIRMENLRTGKIKTNTYKSGEKFDEAYIEEKPMIWLYDDDGGAVFMDEETSEQVSVDSDLVDPIRVWLKDSINYQFIFFKDVVIKISPPFTMEMLVTESSDAVKGDTSGSAKKDAYVETGALVQVPLFIKVGDKIIVDTRDGKYVSRGNN